MANKEAPNTLLSDGVFRVLDMVCEGPISGFWPKPGAYGGDPLVSTYYDDVPVRNTDGSYNFNITGQGYSFDYTLGTFDQTGIAGYQKVESVLPLSSNTRIAKPPDGAGSFKPVIAAFTSNNYPDADAIKVTVRVPSLMAQDAEGNTNPYTIDYGVDISINNGAWVNVGLETIVGKCTSSYQKTTAYQLPKTAPASSYYEWKVRVRRISENILSIRTQNEIVVDSIAVVSTNLYAYPNTVLVGTTVGADQFASLPSRAYEVAGLLVNVPDGYTPTQYGYSTTPFTRDCGVDEGIKHIVFNTPGEASAMGVVAGVAVSGPGIPAGSIVVSVDPEMTLFTIDKDPTSSSASATLTFTPTETVQTITPATYPAIWDGTFQEGVWTDNPAWIFHDLVTHPIHGLGDYIQTSSVDKWTLYRISQYCDEMVDDGDGGVEPRFTCNVAITQPQEAYTVLLNLASTFRGMLYYANGTIHATQQQNAPPVYAFNNTNVVNGVFSYSDTARNTRSTVAKVKWVDPQNSYRENVEYIEDIDGILRYGYQEKEMTAFACTSKGQAFRLGTWTLETERLLTETVTFRTSLEGSAVAPGDNFAIYDNFRNNRTQAGRITAFTPGRSMVTLDKPVAIEPGYTYSLSCIVPKAQFDGTGDITGSDQISLIRQSQVESFQVSTAATSGTSNLVIAGSFSQNLYVGSPFVLAASGSAPSIFNRASYYTCLATAEVEPGQVEILGLQANTGVQFRIQTGYTIVDWPTNEGDRTTAISPPSNLRVTGITGITDDNTFYSSINLTWVNSPSPDLSYYVVSGKEWDTDYERATVIDTGFNFTRGDTGQYLFKVAAVSNGGVYSSFVTGGFLVSNQNPLGTLRPLEGVRLVENADPLYTNPSDGSYTGYMGVKPGFEWNVLTDSKGQTIVDAQFISGYRVAVKWGGDTYYTTDISGRDNTTFQFTGAVLSTVLTAAERRAFTFDVDTVDIYGNVTHGAELDVNNPPMKPPYASGFVGFNGGVIYNVTPSLQYDTSGIYLWANANPSFTPTFANKNFVSSNLAGNARIAPNTGSFWTWFSLIDTFGTIGSTIYGPVSGNANDVFNVADLDISAEINNALQSISGAFGLITGQFTNSLTVVSGENALTLQSVNGLSGQITGLPGVVNTALNVRVDTAVVNTSGSLSTQIDAVRAQTQLTGQQLTATVGSVTTALTNSGVSLGQRIDVTHAEVLTTSGNLLAGSGYLAARTAATGAALLSSLATSGGALAQWITNLGAQTSGQSSSVQIGARAFVTGDVNGIGGVAVATWGFKLDSNGKVVSMQASSEDWGAGSSEYGTIVFGGANLQSNTYSAGSAGWQISADGNVEFNNAVVRGAFSGGAGGSLVSMNAAGLSVGAVAGDRIQLQAGLTNHVLNIYNQSNNIVASLGNFDIGGGLIGGLLTLGNNGGSATINLNGSNGNVNCDLLDVDTTSNFDGQATFNGNALIDGAGNLYFWTAGNGTYITESNGLQLHGVSASNRHVQVKGCDLDCDNDVSAATFTTTSARRFKENITPISGALDTVRALSGVHFDWKTRDVKDDFGLIAEDVAFVLPTAVHYDASGLAQGVDYGRLTAVLVEAVKELSIQVRELKKGG